MNAIMEIKNKTLFIENVNDGTDNSNPQRGYFAVINAVGPFLSEESAQEYLDKESIN